MAREAGIIDFRDAFSEAHVQAVLQDLKAFEDLVRADECRSKPHSLGPGEMELSLRRNHKDDLFECRRRFSAEEVVLGPDFLVEATAKMLDAEMNRAIRARGDT
jgi:hypothetical protein